MKMLRFNSTLFEVAGVLLFPAGTATSLARYLGLSRQYVTKLVNGKAPIPPSLWPDLLRLTTERLTNLLRWHERLVECCRKRRLKEHDFGPNSFFTGRDFASIARATFGDNWTGCMASRLNMSPEYMRKLAKGERPMREPLWLKLEAVCRAKIIELENLEHRLSEFQFPDEIACDWVVEDRMSSEQADGGTVRPFIISGTLH